MSSTGAQLLRNPLTNQGLGFDVASRQSNKLRGLLPAAQRSLDDACKHALALMRKQPNDLAKYEELMNLLDRDEALFYRVVIDNMKEIMPLIYTPTVGDACINLGKIMRRPRGMWVSLQDAGHIREAVANWPEDDVRVVVVTDGGRILGLGDLGACGMGIPIGKLNLYTACAGIPPRCCLPIMLDVGSDNEELRNSEFYPGLRQPRATGAPYDHIVEELFDALKERYPNILIQFEDFNNQQAFRLLEHYRTRVCSFNDDIQGTASVTIAGLFTAVRMKGTKISDEVLLFSGAGEAGCGIAELIVSAMVEEGLPEPEARKRIWMMDSKGLITRDRGDFDRLAAHKIHFCHEGEHKKTIEDAIEMVRPTALIGVSAVGGTFTASVLEAISKINQQPIVFPLSNPTRCAECTAEEAVKHTGGRVLFASGSPFAPVEMFGKTLVPGQGNNAYIFPGVGLGALVAGAKQISDKMFLIAARTLSSLVNEDDIASGCLYPPLTKIREVSKEIAAAVAEEAYSTGMAARPRPADLLQACAESMYDPVYNSARL